MILKRDQNTYRIDGAVDQNRIKEEAVSLAWLHSQADALIVVIAGVHVEAILSEERA